VYLAQRRSQEFFCEPNFWGGVPPGCASGKMVMKEVWSILHIAERKFTPGDTGSRPVKREMSTAP